MAQSKRRSIFDMAYPNLEIDSNTIEGIKRHSKLFRGHVRTSVGKIYTTDEFKKRSDDILGKELP